MMNRGLKLKSMKYLKKYHNWFYKLREPYRMLYVVFALLAPFHWGLLIPILWIKLVLFIPVIFTLFITILFKKANGESL